jgi:hypothetical protein
VLWIRIRSISNFLAYPELIVIGSESGHGYGKEARLGSGKKSSQIQIGYRNAGHGKNYFGSA